MLGVCGGIAAYKAVEVCRRLVDAGAYVMPVMTRGAIRFVGEATFSALASERVRTSLWDELEPIPHTWLGQGADLVLVAPATARLIGSYAAGISNDLLTATLLATRAPVVVCPAMHTEMWENPAVVENVATLRRRGVQIVEPASGRLAGGDVGAGRLADPAEIVDAVLSLLPAGAGAGAGAGTGTGTHAGARAGELAGVAAVVTAGGTREPIDPVRFVGNRSSGKQGYAVAAELARRGADVALISTVDLGPPPGVKMERVETAAQMEAAVTSRAASSDVVVMAAAVADFRPKEVSPEKLKKTDGIPEVVLEPTTDILAALAASRRPGQVLVGFAAETGRPGSEREDLLRYARSKLSSKGADLIVANDVAAASVGFSHDTNAVVILGAGGTEVDVPLTSKNQIAVAVVDAISRALRALSQQDNQQEQP